MYNGHRDALHIKKWILGFLPSPVLELNSDEFEHNVLTHYTPEVPWLVDFYTPWCSHCVVFEPEFITVAQVSSYRLRVSMAQSVGTFS